MEEDIERLAEISKEMDRKLIESMNKTKECEDILLNVLDTQYDNWKRAPLSDMPKNNIQEIQSYFDKYYGENK